MMLIVISLMLFIHLYLFSLLVATLIWSLTLLVHVCMERKPCWQYNLYSAENQVKVYQCLWALDFLGSALWGVLSWALGVTFESCRMSKEVQLWLE